MNDCDEYLDEDNIDTILEKAVEEIQTDTFTNSLGIGTKEDM